MKNSRPCPSFFRQQTTDECGCFDKLAVRVFGVLIARALLFGVHIRAYDFWRLPCNQGTFLRRRGREACCPRGSRALAADDRFGAKRLGQLLSWNFDD